MKLLMMQFSPASDSDYLCISEMSAAKDMRRDRLEAYCLWLWKIMYSGKRCYILLIVVRGRFGGSNWIWLTNRKSKHVNRVGHLLVGYLFIRRTVSASTFFRNVDIYLSDNMTSWPKRLYSSWQFISEKSEYLCAQREINLGLLSSLSILDVKS
jgi:hypothetical protein